MNTTFTEFLDDSKGSINVVCQNRTGFNMKVDMVTVQERVMDWSREDDEAQSGDFCESRNFKKDRKTKEFPRIEVTVFENGIGGHHGRLGSVEPRGTGY